MALKEAGRHEPMADFSIEQLLQACVDRGGSDVHLVVGQPPVVSVNRRMHKLECDVLTPDDTLHAMESITPDRHQCELRQVGGTDFEFGFGDQARFRVSAFLQRGSVAMVMRLVTGDADTPRFRGKPRF